MTGTFRQQPSKNPTKPAMPLTTKKTPSANYHHVVEWSYSRGKRTLSYYGTPFAVVMTRDLRPLSVQEATKLLRALNGKPHTYRTVTAKWNNETEQREAGRRALQRASQKP